MKHLPDVYKRQSKMFKLSIFMNIWVLTYIKGRIWTEKVRNILFYTCSCSPVSYTHLDVYKRQVVVIIGVKDKMIVVEYYDFGGSRAGVYADSCFL